MTPYPLDDFNALPGLFLARCQGKVFRHLRYRLLRSFMQVHESAPKTNRSAKAAGLRSWAY
jgi:hypothetical protein